MADGPEWFAPKRYGIGSGLPVRWQGWLSLAAYAAIVGGTIALAPERPEASLPIILLATFVLMLISARTTRGGWRWRWGDED